MIGSAVCAIHYNFLSLKIVIRRKTAFTKFNVTPSSIINSGHFPDLIRLDHLHDRIHFLLNGKLNFIIQFLTITGKKFNTIITISIVRGADNYPSVGFESSGKISNGWSWHGAKK